MTIKEAKLIDMVSYLSNTGHEPGKIKGINYWYLYPLRTENTPSFKVNRKLKRWFDFGIGKGGNIIDFLVLLEPRPITEILQQLAQIQPSVVPPVPSKTNTEIEIISTHPVSSFPLVHYYTERHIPPAIASAWLQEIRYKNGDKLFYALGFKNDEGGYELRSTKFNGSSRPKASTFIFNATDSLSVFEGFFDFLSYLVFCQYQPTPKRDLLILNSTSFFGTHLPLMQTYRRVHLYLDNDATGTACVGKAQSIQFNQFIDERTLYSSYKDLNEWLIQQGKAPTPKP